MIHALPVIGRRCVFQRLNPAGKGLHLLNEEVGVQRGLIYNLSVHNSCLCQTVAQGFDVDGFFIVLWDVVFVTAELFPGWLFRFRAFRLTGLLLCLFPPCQVRFFLRGYSSRMISTRQETTFAQEMWISSQLCSRQ